MIRCLAMSVLVLLGAYSPPAAAACPWDCAYPGFPWSFPQSTIPQQVRVMGWGADGSVDPAGDFTILIRDLANNPVPMALVELDFTHCAPAILCGVQSTTCDSLLESERRVLVVTDSNGAVTLRLAGCAQNPGNGPISGDGRVRIRACGVEIGSAPVAFADQNGLDGLGANDLSAWLEDAFGSTYFVRSDYDGNAFVGANDLSVWLGLAGSGRSALGCANHP